MRVGAGLDLVPLSDLPVEERVQPVLASTEWIYLAHGCEYRKPGAGNRCHRAVRLEDARRERAASQLPPAPSRARSGRGVHLHLPVSLSPHAVP